MKYKAGATHAPPSLESRSATSETLPGQGSVMEKQCEQGRQGSVPFCLPDEEYRERLHLAGNRE